jgi:Domain of unknown function (DUF222)
MGMGEQPGQGDGEDEGLDRYPEPPSPACGTPIPDPVPDPVPNPAPDPVPAPGPARPARDPRLAAFAQDSPRGAPAPCGALALLIDQLAGPQRRCPGATADEKIGLLRAFAAIESWSAAGKLGLIRQIIRDEGPPSPGSDHGDLPETWSRSLRYELAGALACSTQSAENTAQLAWQLAARLPRTGALLEGGALTQPKARAITDMLSQLSDPDAAAAEALIAGQLPGKTFTQVLRLAEQAALTVDPDMAERWRRHAQENDARVTFFREQAGTAGLSGRDLPPDQALAAMANVNLRAEEYKESEALGDAPMDVLRAHAYLDLINGLPAAQRIAIAQQQDDEATATAQAWAAEAARAQEPRPDPDPDRGDCPCTECDGSCTPDDDDPDDDPETGPGDDGPGPGGSDPGSGMPPNGRPGERRPADLVVPLATLLGLAERPGEIHGFGLLDPTLARDLAAAAAASPRTEVCVTVTSPEGYAIGHGCARPARTSRPARPPGPAASPIALPARLNLTIPATILPRLPAHAGTWSFTPRGRPGTEDGFGTWTLTLPGGRELAVRLEPVPVFDCDHRYETHHYQPSDRLRHLVQIRDGTCTFPTCNRHARESDFEHALPYDKGGKTCACNAGARSRACHQVKQSAGWNVTQPKPGWHRWETPANRVYEQEPKRYPA